VKATAGHQTRPLGVFSSDWHMKPYNWASRPEIRGDALRSALFIKNYCLQQGLPLFVLGDLLDTRQPDPSTVGWLMDIIDDLTKAGLQFNFLQGQHELNRERPWASCHKAARWLHLQFFMLGHIGFYGLDFLPSDRLQEELKMIPTGASVLLAHQVWRERMGGLRSDDNRPAEGAFSDIPRVQMVISGDFHAHKITKHRGYDCQELTTVSPGSTYLKSLDEDPMKFFYLLYDDLTLKSIKLPTRPVWRTRVGTSENLDRYIDNFVSMNAPVHDNEPDKPIWYVEFRPSITDVVTRLERACKGRAHLFPRPLQEKERDDLINTEEVSIEEENIEHMPTSLEDFLPHCCKPNSPVFQTAIRLNRAGNIKEEIKQITGEAIADADKASGEGWNA